MTKIVFYPRSLLKHVIFIVCYYSRIFRISLPVWLKRNIVVPNTTNYFSIRSFKNTLNPNSIHFRTSTISWTVWKTAALSCLLWISLKRLAFSQQVDVNSRHNPPIYKTPSRLAYSIIFHIWIFIVFEIRSSWAFYKLTNIYHV